jgi:hypothetical protein
LSIGGGVGGSVGGGSVGGGGMGGGGMGGGGMGGGGGTSVAGAGGRGGTAGTSGSGGAGGGSAGAGGKGGAGGSAGAGGSGGSSGEGACPGGVLGHCNSGATYPTYAGYTLGLVEDFPVALDLDKDSIFTWSDGSQADGQTGFRKEQISFANGKMLITAEAPAGCAAKTTNAICIPPRMSYAEALSPNAQASVGSMGVWSGQVRSRYDNYRYGRYEVKYGAPVANPGQEATDDMSGNFLSSMFVYRAPRNVQWAEINFELSPWHHDQVSGNLVSATGAVGYPGGNASPFSSTPGGAYAITQEHVYAFNWTPTRIEWFLDGVSIHQFDGSGPAPIPSVSAKIMMDLWVFSGNTFGDGVNNKFPFTASYDYFRFYKLDTETTYPCAPVPACLPAADKTKSAQNNPSEVNYGQ